MQYDHYRQIKMHRRLKTTATSRHWCTRKKLKYLHIKNIDMGQIDCKYVTHIYALVLTHHARALSFYAAII